MGYFFPLIILNLSLSLIKSLSTISPFQFETINSNSSSDYIFHYSPLDIIAESTLIVLEDELVQFETISVFLYDDESKISKNQDNEYIDYYQKIEIAKNGNYSIQLSSSNLYYIVISFPSSLTS